jgi:uncharacterized delta-60 repeat protein
MKTITYRTLTALCVLTLIFTLFRDAKTQVIEEWVKRYNGPGNDEDRANSVAVDSSGNVYVTGYSIGTSTGDDYCTIKYNSSGVQQWALRYNGPGNAGDRATSVAADNSGNVYVTGRSTGSGTGYDYCTIKYNSSGLASWVQRYNGPGNSTDLAESIAIDNSGNVYVTGYSTGSGTSSDYCTIKYNSSGVQQWASRYNGLGNNVDQAVSIEVDNSGYVYVTGRSMTSGTNVDYCTIKYNPSGLASWVQIYNGPGNDYDNATSIAIDNSGNVYITGTTFRLPNWEDYCTIKYSSSGVQQWVQSYTGPLDTDAPYSIEVDNSGNVYVTGYSTNSNWDFDYCTIKYNSLGVQQWVQRYNGPGDTDDFAHSMALDNSGNVYVTGGSTGIGTERDYCTLKYNSSGVQQWEQRYNGPGIGIDVARSIAVNSSGNIYVTGYSMGAGTDYDYCTIKYYDPIGIQPISNETPKSYELYQNYPNPFNPVTNIKFLIPKSAFVNLVIYDVLGREVAVILY